METRRIEAKLFVIPAKEGIYFLKIRDQHLMGDDWGAAMHLMHRTN